MKNNISIIIPVYKSINYIERCIQSICDQSNKNFEVVLVDDGGNDGSIVLATEILNKNNIINKVIYDEKDGKIINNGIANARNKGIENARNKWILCIDSDDYICKDMVKIFIEAVSKYPNYDFYYCNYTVTKDDCYTEKKDKHIEYEKLETEKILYDFYERKDRIIVPCILIEKEKLMKNKLLFPDDSRFSEDSYFIYNLLLRSQKALKIKSNLYYYFINKNSIMTSSNIEKIMTGYNSFVILSKLLKNDTSIQTSFDINKIFPREIIGELHTAAKCLKYRDFIIIRNKMNIPRNNLFELKNDDIFIQLARLSLLYIPSIFYLVAKIL